MANMRKRAIALSVGLLGALGVAGCGGSSTTRIYMTWELQDASGAPASCAAGETVEIQAGNVTDSGIPCPNGAVTTGPVPAGTYDIQVSLIAIDGSVESTTAIHATIRSGVTNDIGHVI